MREIINHFGKEAQLKKAKEELNELIEAIDSKKPDNVLDEVADCIIMIKQVQIMFNLSNEQIDERIDFKMNRTKQRILDEVKNGKVIEVKQEGAK